MSHTAFTPNHEGRAPRHAVRRSLRTTNDVAVARVVCFWPYAVKRIFPHAITDEPVVNNCLGRLATIPSKATSPPKRRSVRREGSTRGMWLLTCERCKPSLRGRDGMLSAPAIGLRFRFWRHDLRERFADCIFYGVASMTSGEGFRYAVRSQRSGDSCVRNSSQAVRHGAPRTGWPTPRLDSLCSRRRSGTTQPRCGNRERCPRNNQCLRR